MKNLLLQIAGVNSEQDFYSKYPSKDAFLLEHPEALELFNQLPKAQFGKSDIYQRAGTVKPLYVESKNDPRYQAYQDSLKAYNEGNYKYNNIKKTGNLKDLKVDLDSEKKLPFNKFIKEYNYNDNAFNLFNEGTGKNMKPLSISHFRGDGVLGYLDYGNQALYKKPQQQVIVKDKTNTSSGNKSESQYKKEHPPIYVTDKNDPRINRYTEEGSQYLYRPVEKKPVRTIKNNIYPEGLVLGNLDVNSTLPTIRPTAKNANFYKVRETTQGIYGPSTVDYDVTDPRNINMNDLGPGNTRVVTPQYQMAGTTKTLYVDKNDLKGMKRYQAYKDSLDTYNTQNAYNAQFLSNFKNPPKLINVDPNILAAIKQGYADKNKIVPAVKEFPSMFTADRNSTVVRSDDNNLIQNTRRKYGQYYLQPGHYTPNSVANQNNVIDNLLSVTGIPLDTKSKKHGKVSTKGKNEEVVREYSIDPNYGSIFNRGKRTAYGFPHTNVINKNIKPVTNLQFHQNVDQRHSSRTNRGAMTPDSMDYDDLVYVNTDLPIYKKPEEEVIVRSTTEDPITEEVVQDRKPIYAIENNLHPAGLIYGNTDLYSELPIIRAEAVSPNSYNVEYSGMRMNGPGGYYSDNQKLNADEATALRAIEQANRQNEYWQNKYGKSVNPKAIERLNTLEDNVTITPQYDKGGKIDPPGNKQKPVYVKSKTDPRYKAYNDSLSIYNASKNQWMYPGATMTTKEDYDRKQRIEDTTPYYAFDDNKYQKDKKNKKIENFENYVYKVFNDESLSSPKDKDAYNRNTAGLVTQLENPVEEKQKNGTIKIYGTVIDGKLDKDEYTLFDPVTETSKFYTSGNTLMSVDNPHIRPIKQNYYALKNKKKEGSINVKSKQEESVNKKLIFKNNSSKTFDNYTYGTFVNDVYKKPTTPVIVDTGKHNPNDPRAIDLMNRFNKTFSPDVEPTERQHIDTLQNNLQPQGLVFRNTDLNSILPTIRPEIRSVDSYDVNYSGTRMDGSNAYYANDLQNVNQETALRAMQQADAQNTYWQNKYGNSKNPKAIERLNTLRDNVIVTPRYQVGGTSEEDLVQGQPLEEVVVYGKPTEFGALRNNIKKQNSWEQFANDRFLGNFEKNMGQTINNLSDSRKQEYEDYINKLTFDEYVKTHPMQKGEKRGEYIDRLQRTNANSPNFERAYEANAEYNPSTDVNNWRKGLMGLGSVLLGPDNINKLKQSSRYFSSKEKANMLQNPISAAAETTLGTFAPLEIPANMAYGENNNWNDALSGRGTYVPMSGRLLADPTILAFEAAPLLSKGLSAAGKALSKEEGLLTNFHNAPHLETADEVSNNIRHMQKLKENNYVFQNKVKPEVDVVDQPLSAINKSNESSPYATQFDPEEMDPLLDFMYQEKDINDIKNSIKAEVVRYPVTKRLFTDPDPKRVDQFYSAWADKIHPSLSLEVTPSEMRRVHQEALDYFNNSPQIYDKDLGAYMTSRLRDKIPAYVEPVVKDNNGVRQMFAKDQRSATTFDRWYPERANTNYIPSFSFAEMGPEHLHASDLYTRGYDATINSLFRRNAFPAVKVNLYDEIAQNLQNAILKNKLAKPTSVRRGVVDDYELELLNPKTFEPTGVRKMRSQLGVGDVFKDDAFMSTSRDLAHDWGETSLAEKINIPGGNVQSYFHPDSGSFSHFNMSENEFLLPKGLVRRVTNTLDPAVYNAGFETELLNPYKKGGYTHLFW